MKMRKTNYVDVHYYSFVFKNTDFVCLRHLASNAHSLQEHIAHLAANQSAHTIVAV